MRITRVRWYRYRIPFRAPFATAHGTLRDREGVLLQLETDDGLRGHGEIAPLPGFGGTVEDALPLLAEAAPRMLGLVATYTLSSEAFGEWVERLPRPGVAAIYCGVDVAVYDLMAQRRGWGVAALLAAEPRRRVPVNATVGSAGRVKAAEQAAAAAAAGFGTIKLKVGMVTDAADEAARVAAVRDAIGPATRLRLDANGAWSREQAVAAIRACERYDLECVEQPVAAADLDGMAALRREVAAPIAADEAATDHRAVRRLIEAEAVDVVVLKPMAAGGLTRTRLAASFARRAGLPLVVTTALEAGVGVAAAAHLAAALAPSHACGLATAGLLESDLLAAPLWIERGELVLPEGPGLGVTVDWEQVARYTVAEGEAGGG